jgi:hypothetical protein
VIGYSGSQGINISDYSNAVSFEIKDNVVAEVEEEVEQVNKVIPKDPRKPASTLQRNFIFQRR